MELIEKLAAIEELKLLKARYCRFVDSKQWDALRDLCAEDSSFDGRASGTGDVVDRVAFVANAATSLTGCVSVHHVHGGEIEVTSATAASGIWAMEDMLEWSEESASPVRRLHGMGHYHETYRKDDGQWKIVTWNLTRLRVDITPA